MISNLENAMAKQTEQATVQATGMESINNGMKPQGIATPDSNCSSINEKETSIGDPEQPVLKTDKKTPVPINDNGACDIKETGAGSGEASKETRQKESKKQIKTEMKKIELKEGVVYHMNEIGIENLKLNNITSNRKDKKQIENKLKSCESTGMQVPAVITDSSIVMEAGYPQANFLTGDEIKTPEDASCSYTIVEGNNRFRGFLIALEKAKKTPSYHPFDYNFIYKKYENAEIFRQAYRNINMYNVPTKTKEFANDVLATTQLPVLVEYKKKIADGLTAKAAGYATIGKEIVKRDMENIFNGKTPAEISNTDILEKTGPVYNAVMLAFSSEEKVKPIVKGTSVWNFNAKKFSASKDKKAESEKLVRLYSGLNSRECSQLMDAKAKDGKTKEQVIHEILEKRYITL